MKSAAGNAVTVERIRSGDQLGAVKQIYREHKSVLGLMPDGAFDDRLANGQIYVASIASEVVGYVLFWRNGRDEVRIAHLAVKKSSQRNGVAKSLIDQIKQDHADCCRIRLNCRSDFAAAAVWPRLDFVACGRKPAKQAGRELTVFQFRLNETPLFEMLDDDSQLPVVVCDANICMDVEYSDRDNHESSSGLLADWLVDEVELRVTEEILNDFDRQDQPIRDRMRVVIRSSWDVIVPDAAEFARCRSLVREVLGASERVDDLSDEKHLAAAAAVKASAFATRDQRILKAATDLLAKTGLRVQRPSEIIAEVASLQSSGKPNFRELRNAGIHRSQVAAIGDVECDQFMKSSRGETIADFRRYLDNALALPKVYRVESISSADGKPLAFVAARDSGQSACRIERLRLAHSIGETRLASALTAYLAQQPLGCVWTNTGEDHSARVVTIEDPWLSPDLARSCVARGFAVHGRQLTRISMPGLWSYESLASQLDELLSDRLITPEHASQLKMLAAAGDEAAIRQLEQQIHPGKVTFGDLPVWILPIQPEWAQELFDIRIWSRPLFSAETTLVLNPDSVYYKRPRNSPTGQFGRILWYVSGDKQRGGNVIRACSVMTKRVTGAVKDVFRQYERMGVFEWKQLMAHFGSASARATAIEFTDTELLPNPVGFDRANEILADTGMKPNQFQSALQVGPAAFHRLYHELTGTH